jgi:hypothetical protein
MSVVNLVGNLVTPAFDSLYIVHSPILDEAITVHHARIDGVVGNLVVKNNNHLARVLVEDVVLNRAITSATPRKSGKAAARQTKEHDMDTSRVTPFPAHGIAQYCVFFSCPVLERTVSIPRTTVLSEPPRTTLGGYFNRKNRAEINISPYSYLFFTATSLLLGSLSMLPVGLLSRFRRNKSTHEQRVWTLSWMVFGFVIGTFAGWWTSVLEFRSRKNEGFHNWVKFFGKMAFACVFAAPGLGGFIVVGKMLREYGNCVSLY